MDENWLILKIMFILSIFSIFGGRILSWLIFPFPYLIILPNLLKYLTLLVCFVGGILGYFLFSFIKFNFIVYRKINNLILFFFSYIWFMPNIFSYKLNYYFLNKGIQYYKRFDCGWNELFSGLFIFNFIKFYSLKLQIYQNNQFKRFFFVLLIILLIFLYLIF
jgi:hypothetical protein